MKGMRPSKPTLLTLVYISIYTWTEVTTILTSSHHLDFTVHQSKMLFYIT